MKGNIVDLIILHHVQVMFTDAVSSIGQNKLDGADGNNHMDGLRKILKSRWQIQLVR